MEWNALLCTKRMREGAGGQQPRTTDLRSEFEKDYHRIIGSASFRRLQDKTQVFPLDKSDFIRTRLTHLWRYLPLENHWDKISEKIF